MSVSKWALRPSLTRKRKKPAPKPCARCGVERTKENTRKRPSGALRAYCHTCDSALSSERQRALKPPSIPGAVMFARFAVTRKERAIVEGVVQAVMACRAWSLENLYVNRRGLPVTRYPGVTAEEYMDATGLPWKRKCQLLDCALACIRDVEPDFDTRSASEIRRKRRAEQRRAA